MTKRLLLLAPVLLSLAGCDSPGSIAGYDLTLESETCRSASVAEDYMPASTGTTADEKLANYERAYVACMQARGYQSMP